MFGLFHGFGGMMGYGGYGYGYNSWGQSLLLGLLIIGVIVGIFYAVRKPRQHQANYRSNQAIETLNTRYANGEIDRETYEQMKQDLS